MDHFFSNKLFYREILLKKATDTGHPARNQSLRSITGRRQEVGSGGTLKRLEHSTCKTRRSTCKTRAGWRLRRQKNIKEIPLKIKSKIYEKLKILNFNVNFQKKSLEKLSHQSLKFCPKISYGGSILLVPFQKKSCRNGNFDFFLSAPQKFANF